MKLVSHTLKIGSQTSIGHSMYYSSKLETLANFKYKIKILRNWTQ